MRRIKQQRRDTGLEAFRIDRPYFIHVVVGKDGVRQLELTAMLRGLVQQVAFPARKAHERHDQVLAVGIYGRVGHLGEQLLEVVV